MTHLEARIRRRLRPMSVRVRVRGENVFVDEDVVKFPASGNIGDPVNIPLGTQIDLFEARRWQVLQQMRDDLHDPDFVARLMALARQRLIDGEAEYGSRMFNWEYDERERNMLEEAADWLVYGTSEDTF